MNGINDILNMVYTEAMGGGIGDHYFDEARNREFIERDNESMYYPEPKSNEQKPKLPPMKYNLELIRDANGNLCWVE